MDKIQGPNFFNYDARYMQIIRHETPQSIKPNIFKEVDESVAMALLISDVVLLSPEAKEILRKLRKRMQNDGGSARSLSRQKDIKDLIYNLQQLRDAVYKDEKEDVLESVRAQPHQIFIPLGVGERDEATRRASRNGQVREILDKMIVYAPNNDLRNTLMCELEVLGEKIVDTVKKFGVKIIILDRRMPLSSLKIAGMSVVARGEKTFDGRDWDTVRGLYDQSRRLMVIGEEKVGLPNCSTARHEFAHAFDHTFTTKNQRRLPLSVQLWNLFREQRRSVVSRYACTNPAEYFAESVEAYFIPAGKEYLRENDSQMFQYLETLFEA